MPASLHARRFVALSLLIVTTLLSSLLVAAPSASAMTVSMRINNALTVVKHQQGDPYAYGGAGPNRFDCSGLVYFSFRRAGFSVPRTAAAQARRAHRIGKRGLRPGDFVFFYRGRAVPANVYHVGVFAGWRHGRRTIIHASTPGTRVHRSPLWTSRWFPGTLR